MSLIRKCWHVLYGYFQVGLRDSAADCPNARDRQQQRVLGLTTGTFGKVEHNGSEACLLLGAFVLLLVASGSDGQAQHFFGKAVMTDCTAWVLCWK